MSIHCRIFLSFCFSVLIAAIIAPFVINTFRNLKIKQSFRDKSEVRELADLHAQKIGTPTMGGVIIFIPVLICSLIFAKLNLLVVCSLITFSVLYFLGMADDFLKISKKNFKGVHGKIKLCIQLALTLSCFFLLKNHSSTTILTSSLVLPYCHGALIILPTIIMIIGFFIVIAGSSNAVNLTDGLDGLAGFQTFINAIFWCFACYLIGTKYITTNQIAGIQEVAIICSSLAGSTLVFLWHNCSPASIFMGDTGSLSIGGLFGIIAIISQRPFLLVLTGLIFVIEAISVMLQVYYFKLTNGKRIFRMAPLHHHFELGGMKEQKIVIRALIITIILSVFASILIFFY